MIKLTLLMIFSIFSFAVSAREFNVAKTGNRASADKRMVYKAAMDTIANGQIILGSTATELETYAARELQRCLYKLSGDFLPIVADDAQLDKASFVVGRPENNKLLQEFLKQGILTVSAADPGEQGYVLKKLTYN